MLVQAASLSGLGYFVVAHHYVEYSEVSDSPHHVVAEVELVHDAAELEFVRAEEREVVPAVDVHWHDLVAAQELVDVVLALLDTVVVEYVHALAVPALADTVAAASQLAAVDTVVDDLDLGIVVAEDVDSDFFDPRTAEKALVLGRVAMGTATRKEHLYLLDFYEN